MRIALLALVMLALVPLLGRERLDRLRMSLSRYAKGGANVVVGLIALSLTRTFLEGVEAMPITLAAAGLILFGLMQASGWFTPAARPAPAVASRPRS